MNLTEQKIAFAIATAISLATWGLYEKVSDRKDDFKQMVVADPQHGNQVMKEIARLEAEREALIAKHEGAQLDL